MVAFIRRQPDQQAAHITGSNLQAKPKPGQRRRSLSERMTSMYWRIARRRRVLHNMYIVFRDDLVIYPMQVQEAATHLLALRQATQQTQEFYSTLAPRAMAQINPLGTITKLNDLDNRVTELLLFVVMLETAQEDPYTRVQLHLLIRQLFPQMLASFEDGCSQLAALVERQQSQEEEESSNG
jgi:hypothetical protein